MSTDVIAFVGGGQLAQMIGEAAAPLGITCRSSAVDGSCAFSSCEAFTDPLDDEKSYEAFLDGVTVFSFESEHEGIPESEIVAQHGVPVCPSTRFVRIAGDRLLEKTMLSDLEIPVAPFEEISSTLSRSELATYIEDLHSSTRLSPHGFVIKTRRGGYDGKGQWVVPASAHIEAPHIAEELFNLIGDPGCIVEGLVDFSMECSIVAARSIAGDMCMWPLTHNIHEDSILRFSYAPITGLDNLDELETQARDLVTRLCNENDYVGSIAVECFVTPDGLVINEIAPRVHNSGHWTIEGSQTSQFEQHARAVTGRELGDVSTRGFSAMINLIGRDVDADAIAQIGGATLHWYGKEVRPARKVGHITIVADSEILRNSIVSRVKEVLQESANL